jgi:hypothetical protein
MRRMKQNHPCDSNLFERVDMIGLNFPIPAQITRDSNNDKEKYWGDKSNDGIGHLQEVHDKMCKSLNNT